MEEEQQNQERLEATSWSCKDNNEGVGGGGPGWGGVGGLNDSDCAFNMFIICSERTISVGLFFLTRSPSAILRPSQWHYCRSAAVVIAQCGWGFFEKFRYNRLKEIQTTRMKERPGWARGEKAIEGQKGVGTDEEED